MGVHQDVNVDRGIPLEAHLPRSLPKVRSTQFNRGECCLHLLWKRVFYEEFYPLALRVNFIVACRSARPVVWIWIESKSKPM